MNTYIYNILTKYLYTCVHIHQNIQKKKEKSLQTKYLNVLISSIKPPQKKKKNTSPWCVFVAKKNTLFWVPGHLAATLVPSTSKKRPLLLMGWEPVGDTPKKPRKKPQERDVSTVGKKKREIPEVFVFFCVFFKCVKLWKLWNWWWLSWVLHGLSWNFRTMGFAGKDERKLIYGLVLFLSNQCL